ncbi:unnamed protein product [Amaranthus hypochondriacus]
MEAGALKNVDNAALENKSDDALISEDNILLVHVENNGGGELAATEKDVVLSCTQATGPCGINDIVSANTGTTLLSSFEIGSCDPPLKKSSKPRKKSNRDNIKILRQNIERGEGSE